MFFIHGNYSHKEHSLLSQPRRLTNYPSVPSSSNFSAIKELGNLTGNKLKTYRNQKNFNKTREPAINCCEILFWDKIFGS